MKSTVAIYGFSLAAVAAAVVVRLLLEPVLGDRLPFITLFAAIVVAAWYGGRGPALLALVAGAVAAAFFLLQPRFSFTVDQPEFLVGLALYGGVGLLSVLVFEALRNAQRQAEERQRQLEQEIVGRRAAEKELVEREELLRITFASIGDAVITTDANGNVTYLNAVAQELTGWTDADAHGQPLTAVFRIINEGSRQPVESPVEKALREGRAVGLANHTLLISRDGTERVIDDSAAPIRDGKDRIMGVVLIFRDVSGRRKTETDLAGSAERFRLAAEAVNGIIYEYDFRTGHVERTRGLYEVLGYRPDEVPPTPQWWWEQLHPEDRSKSRPTIEQAIDAGRNVVSEYRVRHKDGRWLHVVDRAVLLKDGEGGPVKMIGCTVDVTQRKEAEEALRQSEARFKLSLRASGILVYATDTDLRYIWIHNPHPAFQPEDVVGRRDDELLSPQEAAPLIAVKQRVLESGVGEQAEFSVEIAARQHVYHISVEPFRDERGAIIGVTAAAMDITARKEAECAMQESERRFRTLAETAPSIIWTAAPDGTITYANRRWFEYCGIAEEDNARRWPELVLHPDDSQRCLEAWTAALREGTEYQVEVRNRRRDGAYRWFVTKATPLKDEQGQVLVWFGVTTDIHDQKMMEEQLREADRRKDEFLATLAHELRNPLAPIRNALQLMKVARTDAYATEQARSMMERQLGQMIRLIDDLMDLTRVSQGKIVLRKVRMPVALAVTNAVETSRPLVEAAAHVLNLDVPDEPIYVEADETRLSQVFANILNNAAKYTDRGGRIRVAVRREGDEVVVAIEDTGVGIPAHMLPKVFDIFTQVGRSLEMAQGGLGIGLNIVKRLVEMHGGSVAAESEGHGLGSRFVVRLPVVMSLVSDGQGDEEGAAPRTAPHRRILIVDDNEDAASSLALLLNMMGNDTRTAHDGQAAVELAGALLPDVILMDIGMPKLNGYDACKRIREQPWGRGMVIVACTGWGQEDDRRRSQEAGFDTHMVKPVDPAALDKLLAGLKTETA